MNPAIDSFKTTLSVPGAFSLSLLGFAIVFCVLVVLMFVIKALRGALEQIGQPQTGTAAAPAPAPVAMAAPMAPTAPTPVTMVQVAAGPSQGDITLRGVDGQTAALIMATVAGHINAPLNELRFLSISEKK